MYKGFISEKPFCFGKSNMADAAVRIESLIILLLLFISLAGCHNAEQADPFQNYLDSLKTGTAITGSDPDGQVTLRFDGRTYCYEKVTFSESGPVMPDSSIEEIQRIKAENQVILEGFIGEYLVNDRGREFYRVKDHDGSRYLIRKTPQGDFSVYEFKHFKVFYIDSPYLYGDVLSNVYGIESADGIRQIVFLPDNSDNTPDGQAVQKEIGTVTVRKRSDIQAIYSALKEMTCYGEFSLGREDLPCYRESTISAMKDGRSFQDPWKNRRVQIDLKSGSSITELRYSAVWGGFYDNYRTAYHDLTDEQMRIINRLAKIQTD